MAEEGEVTSPPRSRPSQAILARSPSLSPIRDDNRRSDAPAPADGSRKRKLPGSSARVSAVDLAAIRRRQQESRDGGARDGRYRDGNRDWDRRRDVERERERDGSQFSSHNSPPRRGRGVQDIVRRHYNNVPQRGREWRTTDSQIKGLRSFNNWVKTVAIQKFSPDEEFLDALAVANGQDEAEQSWVPRTTTADAEADLENKGLLVIDLGCGKGGDLGKWQQAPQRVDLYVGLDPADISIDQATERYDNMRRPQGRKRPRRDVHPLFHAEFAAQDCFAESLADVPIVKQVGFDENVGPGGNIMSARWGGGGFDVVVCMFAMHYAFENEVKARQMLKNVSGLLKKGGRFIGVSPNSDVISAEIVKFHQRKKTAEKEQLERKQQQKTSSGGEEEGEAEDGEVVNDIPEIPEWGNDLYRVQFDSKETPEDGIFRPPFGWKYTYYLSEAVGTVPEYVVPWEAFRA